jgi:hypothetical protein
MEAFPDDIATQYPCAWPGTKERRQFSGDRRFSRPAQPSDGYKTAWLWIKDSPRIVKIRAGLGNLIRKITGQAVMVHSRSSNVGADSRAHGQEQR